MSAAHQTTVTVESTPVGARYRMGCSGCNARTPLMSKEAATLAADRHVWETEPGATSPSQGRTTRRRGRSV